MLKKKIIFMGTPNISSIYLESLISKKYNIMTVYSQPPRKQGRGMLLSKSPVHQMANLNNINVLTPIDLNSDEEIKKLKTINPDLIIVMGYGLKLPKYILEMPRFGCINIHVSMLPRWRGAAPIEYSLMNGDDKTGITIFKLVEQMDAGPIIANMAVSIDKDINKDDLTKKLNKKGIELLNETLPNIFKRKIYFLQV